MQGAATVAALWFALSQTRSAIRFQRRQAAARIEAALIPISAVAGGLKGIVEAAPTFSQDKIKVSELFSADFKEFHGQICAVPLHDYPSTGAIASATHARYLVSEIIQMLDRPASDWRFQENIRARVEELERVRDELMFERDLTRSGRVVAYFNELWRRTARKIRERQLGT